MPKWVKATFKVAKNSVSEFFSDNCLNVAAAIAYYTLQSIFPLVLGMIVVGSFFLQEGEARANFINGVKSALPNLGNFNLGEIIDGLTKSAPGLLSISGLLLLWSGSGIFDQLIFGVNVAYDVKKDNRNFFLKLGLRLGLLLVLGLLIAAAFSVTILSQLLFSAKVELFGISPGNFSFLLPVISYLVPIALMFCVFAILYKVGPDRKGNKWRYVVVGALVAAVLFEILKYGFTFYITAFNASDSYAKTYGTLGGVVLFLFYIWISAAIMLFGAEVASVMGGWKSALEGPAAQEDPGIEVEAEKVDSPEGPLVTGDEKARGQDQPEPATQAEGKEGKETKPAEKPKTTDKAKAPQPVPALAASASRSSGRRDPKNMAVGGAILVATFLTGIFLNRKGNSSKKLFN
jgi:membrane protein